MKLLYIEDEPDIREIAEIALEDEGFEIEFCESGLQALDRLSHLRPDVILLDVMMPGMDGPTTLEQLRKIPGCEQIPVIFLTAKVQPREVAEFIGLGALGVIHKPFDPLQLADQIRNFLEQE